MCVLEEGEGGTNKRDHARQLEIWREGGQGQRQGGAAHEDEDQDAPPREKVGGRGVKADLCAIGCQEGHSAAR